MKEKFFFTYFYDVNLRLKFINVSLVLKITAMRNATVQVFHIH